MAWTQRQLLIAVFMIITGSINTLSTKWADTLKSRGRDGEVKNFNHPFFQASSMFLGEFCCLLAFKFFYRKFSKRNDGTEDVHDLTKGNRHFNPLILFIPAMCDMMATSIMYIGLNLTFVSSFQMFRGSVIVFVGLLSTGFLERMLNKSQWSGIFFVILGLAIVGITDFVYHDNNGSHGRNDIITGDMLIIIAQIIQAVQMVVEEKFVAGQDIPPLQAVGWEGVFGFTVLALLQIPFYFIRAGPPVTMNPGDRLEDAIDAFVQIGNNWRLALAVLGTVVSIAFFNFTGISVTKELSATTRMVLDSVRTIVVWVFSLAFFGQKFHFLQLFGFNLLIMGMCLYNGISPIAIFIKIFLKIKSLFTSRRYNSMEEEIIENRNAEDTEP
ncbi:solute carrier family 35 member F6 [Diabrotica virgifera virgifera]|uniref:EamA domain-containing protein n=1 Tax=Diabrotica virgifera virgifera TaxID=50390 RepID=A0ABM5JPQ0_DIAVI|nr:solute carrier family 35 member F6 [Diabrotica virgifera virgifera]